MYFPSRRSQPVGSRRSSARAKNLEGTVRGTRVERAQGREEEEGEDSDVVEIVLLQCQFCAVRLEQEGLMRHMAFVHFKARWVSSIAVCCGSGMFFSRIRNFSIPDP
jgi:hypothetical protein